MSIKLDISADAEAALRTAWGADLQRAAFEALVVEGYRAGKFGAAAVGRLLGHASRWETEQWLAERGVPLNYTLADLEADRRTLDRLFQRTA